MNGDEWGRLWPMKKLLDGGTWGRLCVRGIGVFLAVRLLCLLRRIFGGGAGLGGGIDLLALFGKSGFTADGGDVYWNWQWWWFAASCFQRRHIQCWSRWRVSA